jgi:D-alanyl-lipoteichoic acid acyltransferase DltB (MBOAT superfamily)
MPLDCILVVSLFLPEIERVNEKKKIWSTCPFFLLHILLIFKYTYIQNKKNKREEHTDIQSISTNKNFLTPLIALSHPPP